jgi:hypothetical protein
MFISSEVLITFNDISSDDGEISIQHNGKAIAFYGPNNDGLMIEIMLDIDICKDAIDNVLREIE